MTTGFCTGTEAVHPVCRRNHALTAVQKHELLYHLFADDMQGMLHGPPADVSRIVSTLTNCFTDVSHWCAAKRLQLNASKTEVIWFGLDLQPT